MFWKKRNIVNNSTDLYSIHIPKTAGSSFKKVLGLVYGDHLGVLNRGQIRKKETTVEDFMENQYKVIHGHLYISDLKDYLRPNSKVITWLRHPVDRVLSNYFYTNSVERKSDSIDPNKREKIDLEDYINRDLRKNLISRYLEGINLEDLFFVGFQENFSSDLNLLAQKLDWSSEALIDEPRINENATSRYKNLDLDDEILKRIEVLNERDLEIYSRALDLKSKNYWS